MLILSTLSLLAGILARFWHTIVCSPTNNELRTSTTSLGTRSNCFPNGVKGHGLYASCFQIVLAASTFAARSALTSRMGGWPKKRLYSRLNWLTLS